MAYVDGVPFSELPILENVALDDYVAVLDVSTGTLKRAQSQQIAPPPVDVVEEGNMHYVTSNAVARDVGAAVDNLQEELGQAVEDIEQDLTDAVNTLQENFQAGVDSVYDACESRGSTPASHALDDVVTAIGRFYVPTGTIDIVANGDYNVTEYETAHVDVPNTNTELYDFPAGSGEQQDLGLTNAVRYVKADKVYEQGKQDEASGMASNFLCVKAGTGSSETHSSGSYTCPKPGIIFCLAYWSGTHGYQSTSSSVRLNGSVVISTDGGSVFPDPTTRSVNAGDVIYISCDGTDYSQGVAFAYYIGWDH